MKNPDRFRNPATATPACPPPRWITFTPKHFVADAAHMARDTGLLSTGFERLGVRCDPMMPTPWCDEDDPRIRRAEAHLFHQADYWKSLGAEGVVLYAWAMPQFTSIARAIKEAGLKLMVHLDTSGLLSPRLDGTLYNHLVLQRHRMEKGWLLGTAKALAGIARGMIPRVMDLPRLEHMAFGDVVGVVSPIACERVRRFARHYNREDVVRKIRLALHPISPEMRWEGEHKEKRLCIVGRWRRSDWVKNPWLLAESLGLVLARHRDHEAVVVGPYDGFFEGLMKDLPSDVKRRIHLPGRLGNEKVAEIYRTSRIGLCTSFSEGFHTSSAEAICSGCSLAGYQTPFIPNLPYYTAGGAGTLAAAGRPDLMAGAMATEIKAWEEGGRDPAGISARWTARLHADKVAARVMRLCENPDLEDDEA